MSLEPNRRFNPQNRDKLLARPEIKQRLLILNVICAAFFAAPAIYFAILYAGVLGEPAEDVGGGFPLWYILVFLSVSTIPVMFLMGTVLLRGLSSAQSWSAAFERGQQLLIIELAIGEAVSVYGLVGGFLGAPRSVQYGLIVLGVVLMACAAAALRGKILDSVANRLAEEEAPPKR